MDTAITFEKAYKSFKNTMKISTFEDSQCEYNERSKTYDEQHRILGLTHSVKAANICLKHVSSSKETTLLDIGTGTGNVVVHLREDGFKGEIDLLEANMEMLYVASKKNINARNMIRHVVNGTLPVKPETYDAVTCIGCLLKNGIPAQNVRNMLDVVKRGGFFIFNIRGSGTAYDEELDYVIKTLIEEKQMELVESQEFFILERLSELPTKLVVYRKL